MFLKSLQVRGFKSFANKTTLAFEPGISVVVGPNGSGKSNVVDAICWVLGEQGPATLRGGRMADVIFAGSGTRPPLGMAEVELAIDNSAGLLPIDFSEVSIARTLFRSGDSEYRLNGSVCRLLDIQEMLSDAGVGRAQHTIVGQGRVDQVLHADPAAVRSIIEEAAGVGKHRRRRERALRKIESCEGNLEHLSDLLAEIRRQLKPLRQQAELARRHDRISREVQRIELIEASRELARILDELGPQEFSRREDVVRLRERELNRLDAELTQLEEARMASATEASRCRELQLRLNGALERLEGLRRLAEERGRALRAELASDSEAGERARIQELQRQIAVLEPELAGAMRVEQEEAECRQLVEEPADAARAELAASDEELAAALQRRAEAAARVEGLELEHRRAEEAVPKAESERVRDQEDLEQAGRQADIARRDLAEARRRLEDQAGRVASTEGEVDRAGERQAELESLRAERLEEVRALEKEVAVLRARRDARSGSGSRPVSGGAARMLSEVIGIDPGHRRALEALIGPLDAVAVADARHGASDVLDRHEPDQAATVLIADPDSPRVAGAEPLLEKVEVLDPVAGAVLANVFVARDREHAIAAAGEHPSCVFLSPDGTAARGRQVSRGSAEVHALLAGCEEKLAAARNRLADAERRVDEAQEASRRAATAREEAARLREQLERGLRTREQQEQAAGGRETRLAEEVERSDGAVTEARRRVDEAAAELPVGRAGLQEAEDDLERARLERSDRLANYDKVLGEAQQMRMKLGIASERLEQLRKRKRQAEEALTEAGDRLAGLASQQQVLQKAAEKAAAVVTIAELLGKGGAGWPREAETSFTRAREELHVNEQRLGQLRARRTELVADLDGLRAEARDEDLRRGELNIRRRVLEARIGEEMQEDPQECVRIYGRQDHYASEEDVKDPLERLPGLDDEELRARRIRLERELTRLGNVNPLAAAEAEALEKREEFLAAQIDDVRASRRDLRQVVTSVDAKIEELFEAAFHDVAAEYGKLFGILFPRGRGRLRLVEPGEMLDSGVEVEASPSGKALKRLSLLSGGERAMAGLALLFAVFRARPSPFYILDEVEAALDDPNLRRFLGLLNEFRGTSQLLIVTHQKRTMEVADVLYGVTIGQDGVSKVVSERLKDYAPRPATPARTPAQRTGVNEQ